MFAKSAVKIWLVSLVPDWPDTVFRSITNDGITDPWRVLLPTSTSRRQLRSWYRGKAALKAKAGEDKMVMVSSRLPGSGTHISTRI